MCYLYVMAISRRNPEVTGKTVFSFFALAVYTYLTPLKTANVKKGQKPNKV